MVITSASSIENNEISYEGEYISAVCHYGMGLLTGFVEGIANIFGFRNTLLEQKIKNAQKYSLDELVQKASEMQYNAIINVRINMSGRTVIVSGQAVRLKAKSEKNSKIDKDAVIVNVDKTNLNHINDNVKTNEINSIEVDTVVETKEIEQERQGIIRLSDLPVETDEDENFVFEYENNRFSIINYLNKRKECIEIPSVYRTMPVCVIKDGAFENSENMEKIIFPNTLTSIGSYLFFNCKKLRTIKYLGTMEEWETIDKKDKWNGDLENCKVECSDGEIDIK